MTNLAEDFGAFKTEPKLAAYCIRCDDAIYVDNPPTPIARCKHCIGKRIHVSAPLKLERRS